MMSPRQRDNTSSVVPLWTSEVPWIDVRFETATQLAGALARERVPFELVVPGSFARIGVGERVRASVEVRGFEPLTVRGVLVWRRMGRRPGLPPAIGVRLDSDSGKAALELHRIASSSGASAGNLRDGWKWPALRGA